MVKLFFVVALLGACLAVQISAVDVEEAWANFQAHHPQNTKSASELARRKRNFARTHAEIEKHNKGNSTFEQEHNKFSVMDDEEIKGYLGGEVEVPAGARYAPIGSSMEQEATSLDYRTDICMPAVKNQGNCGSCWAFAATAVVEFGKCATSGTKVSLSEQQLVDCSKGNSGCNGGSPVVAWRYLSTNSKGQYTSASYPYKAVAGTCRTGTQGALVSSSSPVTYIAPGDVQGMMDVLNERRLLEIIIQVVKSFTTYKTGVYDENDCTTGVLGNHVMALVGYGTLNDVEYWVVRNSWGANWGASGYVLFKRGSNLCNIESYAATTTVV